MVNTKRTASELEYENQVLQENELKLLKSKLVHEDDEDEEDVVSDDLNHGLAQDKEDLAVPTALFSKNSHRFALQSPNNHNYVKIYSIFDDVANKEIIKAKNLFNLDLTQDFSGDEILDMVWCDDSLAQIKDIATKKKRRSSSSGASTAEKETIKQTFQLLVDTNQIFVCLFKSGSLVMFENEKIVNIIKLKSEVVSIKAFKNKIYVLDSDSMIKIFDTRNKKHIKSFTLIEGKNETINAFHIIKSSIDSHEDAVELMLATDDFVYIINPSGRRPVLIRKIEITGCFDLRHVPEKQVYAILTIDSIMLYDYSQENFTKTWQFEGERLEVCYDAIKDNLFIISFSLTHNSLFIFEANYKKWISNIVVKNSDIVEFQSITNSGKAANNKLIVSWLNINEPRFRIFELSENNLDQTIIIDNLLPVEEMIIENKDHNLEDKEKSQRHFEDEEFFERQREAKEKEEELKLTNSSKNEKNRRFDELISAIKQKTSDFSEDDIVMKLVINQVWTDDLTKEFIVTRFDSQDDEDSFNDTLIFSFYEKLSKHISANPWQNNKNSTLFIKWILTLNNVFVSKKISASINKTNKALEKSLEQSVETLPSLLSIQGKLEMLIAQEELRIEMGEIISEVDDEEQDLNSEIAVETDYKDNDDIVAQVLGNTSSKNMTKSDSNIQMVDGEANDDE
ncbi:hypothetical protein QEN19_001611 [Hanseniaspora menglaensis]